MMRLLFISLIKISQLVYSKLMLRHSLRLLGIGSRNGVLLGQFVPKNNQLSRISYLFSKSHKQDHKHEHKHQHKQDAKQSEDRQNENEEKDEHVHHGKKEHGHHHESHKQPKHHKGQSSHDEEHHHHQAHHTKLSKMSFEELMEIKTEEAVRYANLLFEKEHKQLLELQEEKEHLKKNIQFYKKVEEEIKEKEVKLEENIKTFEEDIKLSKRRAEREVEESKNFAVSKIAKELLEVADCISNCRKFASESEHKDKYIEMVVDSQQVIQDILKKYQIEQFDPLNKQFDPNTSEAMVNIPAPPGYKPNHVAMTMRTGYMIHGRLLRSARVGVFV